MWKKYGKSLAMLLGTLAMAVFGAYREYATDGISPSEWVLVVIAAFTVVNVWLAANLANFAEKTKTLVAAIGLVLNLLVSLITGGITGDEWILLLLQFLGALGVAGSPATKQIVQRTVVSR